jgi:hypothetical protein
MAHKTKGKRQTPETKTAEELLAELKKRPDRPIEVLCEDAAVLEGLIDLLVIKGTITEEELVPHTGRYQSVITALIMILVEKGVISELELEKATLAFHFARRHCSSTASLDEIFEARRTHLKTLLEA